MFRSIDIQSKLAHSYANSVVMWFWERWLRQIHNTKHFLSTQESSHRGGKIGGMCLLSFLSGNELSRLLWRNNWGTFWISQKETTLRATLVIARNQMHLSSLCCTHMTMLNGSFCNGEYPPFERYHPSIWLASYSFIFFVIYNFIYLLSFGKMYIICTSLWVYPLDLSCEMSTSVIQTNWF